MGQNQQERNGTVGRISQSSDEQLEPMLFSDSWKLLPLIDGRVKETRRCEIQYFTVGCLHKSSKRLKMLEKTALKV